MNASTTFQSELLKLLFQNIGIANIGDTVGIRPSADAVNLYLRLCTDASAVDAYTIGTECAYSGYLAGGVPIPRSAAYWEVDSGEVWNVNEILFGACTGGIENIRYAEVWRNNTSNAETDRVAWIRLDDDLEVSVGVTPKIPAAYFGFTIS